MLPNTLRITLCVGVIIYFILLFHYLKNKMLELKYTLMWILAGLVMGTMVFFPQLLIWFVGLLGIQSNMNGLFILSIAFIILILMTMTSIASRTTMKMRQMIQEYGILEKRVRELEQKTEILSRNKGM